MPDLTGMRRELGSVEDTKWLFASMKWEGSALLLVTRILANLFACLSLFTWLRYYLAHHKKPYPPWVAEAWVALLLIVIVVGLSISEANSVKCWVIISAVYVLMDSIGSVIRDVVISPTHYKDEYGPYISVYDGTRWLILGLLNVIEVVLCFAVLFLHYGQQFSPVIEASTTAIYFSSVTFISLGYGDISPACLSTKMLVCCEISAFLLFLAVRVPAAVSILRVKEEATGPKPTGEEEGGKEQERPKE